MQEIALAQAGIPIVDSGLHEEAAHRRHKKEPNLCAVLAPTSAFLWNRESEWGAAALQEIHIEMELEITVAWY